MASMSSPASSIEIHKKLEMEMTSSTASDHRHSESEPNAVHDCVPEGVSLTWEDLWVTVPDGRTGSRSILQSVTGYARPGEILAIMGPSGCGKSTLLDALAGRLDSNTRQSGEILVNGLRQTLAYGTSAYVTQDEVLITTLTVKEYVYYSAQLQLPSSMSKSEKKERAEITIREMGLQDSENTRIGGWGVKGLSGGQKRRVSICIEILTRPKLLFLDEPISGLDSAASYYVMRRIFGLDQHEGRTIIVSIHQPSSEVFGLFHNLCLLSSGRTVYFGPAGYANEFFALNGCPCPSFQNPSDHFLITINKDFDQDIEHGLDGMKPTEEVITRLMDSFSSSSCCQQVHDQVAGICKKAGRTLEKKRNNASFSTQCLVLTRRSFVNMYRDFGYYWLRFAIYFILSLGIGTIFRNSGSSTSTIQTKSAMMAYVVSFFTFLSCGGFPSFVEDLKVFGRERLNGHYPASAFVIAHTFSSTPYLLLISIIPVAMAYYLTGLQRGLEYFVYFAGVVYACLMLVEGLMMIVAALVPHYLMGIVVDTGILAYMALAAGFFRLPKELPHVYWKYPLYYIAFHKYAFQGLYKNEFEGQTYVDDQVRGGQKKVTGEYILRKKWQVEMGHSKWIDLVIILGMVVFYRIMFLVIIKIVEKAKPAIRGFMFPVPKKQMKQLVVNPYATLVIQ